VECPSCNDYTDGVEIWTLGFSNRTWDRTLELVSSHGLGRVVDIRTAPGSRHAPQFNRQHLEVAFPSAGIEYVHLKALGGFRKPDLEDETNAGWRNASFRGYADYMQTAAFEAALARLIELAAGARTAYACTEAVFWRCHRALVSDALTVRGFDVRHIAEPGRSEIHRLTSFARVDGMRVTYPEESLWSPRAR
jgi:uncharacterized protein (DUF488 family)